MIISLCFALLFMDQPIVENGLEPTGKAFTLEFHEDLRLGPEQDDDHTMWSAGSTGLTVDEDGRLYVADTGSSRILAFEPDGRFIRVVVQKGNGPGEIAALQSFQIFANGQAIAHDLPPGSLPKFHFFDDQLKFVNQRLLKEAVGPPRRVQFAPDGTIFAANFASLNAKEGKIVTRAGVMDLNLKTLLELSALPQKIDFQKFSDPNYLANFIAEGMRTKYNGSGVMNFDGQGHFYSAVTNTYEITKWSPDLQQKLLRVKRRHKPISNPEKNIRAMVEFQVENYRRNPSFAPFIDEAFIDKIIRLMDLPPVKIPVFGIIPMEDGQFLVINDIDAITGRQQADIFDEEGTFIGQVSRNHWAFVRPDPRFIPRMFFRNGFSYTVETAEEGDIEVVRYRYKLVPAG